MAEHTGTVEAKPVALLTLAEVQQLLRIGRTTLHGIVRRGELDVVEVAGRRMVEAATLEAYVAASRRSAREAVASP